MTTLTLTLAAVVVAGSVLSGAFTQGAAPTTRRYLSDEQWAEIEKMPEMDPSKLVPAADIDKLVAEDRVLFLDVRESQEVQDLGTIPGHVNIPFFHLQRRMGELPKTRSSSRPATPEPVAPLEPPRCCRNTDTKWRGSAACAITKDSGFILPAESY